jgi:hypothetical protein
LYAVQRSEHLILLFSSCKHFFVSPLDYYIHFDRLKCDTKCILALYAYILVGSKFTKRK